MSKKLPKEIKILLVVYSGSMALSALWNITINDIPKDYLFEYYMNKSQWCPTIAFTDALHFEGITLKLINKLDLYFAKKVMYHKSIHKPLECLCSHQEVMNTDVEVKNMKLFCKIAIPKWCLTKSDANEWIKTMFERGCVAFPSTITDAVKTGNLNVIQSLLKKLVIHPHNNMLFEACIDNKQPLILGFFMDHFDANSSTIRHCIELCSKRKALDKDPIFDEMLMMLNVAGLTPIDTEMVKVDF